MKIFMLRAAAGAVIAAAGLSAASAQAATATATARAQVIQPVTVTRTADLDFGAIVAGTNASTVAVTPAGVRNCGSSLTCTGTVTAAGFNVVGAAGQTVQITTDASVSLTSGSNSMTAALNNPTSSLVLAAGNNPFNVGGTLSVGANQAAGAYVGSFTVTVNYN